MGKKKAVEWDIIEKKRRRKPRKKLQFMYEGETGNRRIQECERINKLKN